MPSALLFRRLQPTMSADDMDVDTDGVSDDDMDSIGGAGPIGDVLDDMESGNLPPIQPPQNVPAASDLAPSVENRYRVKE